MWICYSPSLVPEPSNSQELQRTAAHEGAKSRRPSEGQRIGFSVFQEKRSFALGGRGKIAKLRKVTSFFSKKKLSIFKCSTYFLPLLASLDPTWGMAAPGSCRAPNAWCFPWSAKKTRHPRSVSWTSNNKNELKKSVHMDLGDVCTNFVVIVLKLCYKDIQSLQRMRYFATLELSK